MDSVHDLELRFLLDAEDELAVIVTRNWGGPRIPSPPIKVSQVLILGEIAEAVKERMIEMMTSPEDVAEAG